MAFCGAALAGDGWWFQMTRPNGKVFISYRRTHAEEVERIVRWLHLLGVPTWQDVHELDHAQTEREISRVLADEMTSGAVLFLTRDVSESDMMKNVEIRAILDRSAKDPLFKFLPVVADGLRYEEVDAVMGAGLHQPSLWHLGPMVQSNPLSEEDAFHVAAKALKQRIAALSAERDRNQSFKIQINTWGPRQPDADTDLCLDWHQEFGSDPSKKVAAEETWQQRLLPTLATIKTALAERACTRLSIAGNVSLSAAFAAGNTFRFPAGFVVEWQNDFEGKKTWWTLSAKGSANEPSIVGLERYRGALDTTDLAVLISVNRDVRSAYEQSTRTLPRMRDRLHFCMPRRSFGEEMTGSEAASATREIMRSVDRTRTELKLEGTVHFFVSAPAGFCFFLGQLSNTLGQVVFYEHLPGADIPYVHGVSFNASTGVASAPKGTADGH